MFRPQDFSGKYKLKNNPVGRWHYQHRREYPSHIIRVGGYLHYFADHSPRAVRNKWKTAFRKFCKLHPKF